ncbi:hypothetical protein P168DRAFT_278197 [Aspergillus campestris IBT 28561]|uniref:Secreted protein n=1 Tax=Aspergillus campestris (strain IBT 28561) TaxID=1392248 RepID=A0A2I1DFI1_ASPC2|nr:uncharacterized protein P168DRAFT_278197 [Aspergillus campestris IBT 28561]PKY08632.1 hypothetical protein P168DRAFT_278197 [Aspergillus campestris IBT 28561]
MWSVIPIVLFSLVASASPVDHSLTRRDFCDGVDAMPVLYHEYGSDKCKPKYSLSDDGVCRHTSFEANRCAAFCQVRTNFFYGQEQPFVNTFCHGPETCTITSTHTRTVGWSLSITPQIQNALKVGVSGGFSGSSGDAVAHSYSIKLESGQCGYFTFVPVVKSVCGSLSTQSQRVMFSPWPVHWCINDYKTTGNVCGDELRLNPDGSVDGETIFVRTNCENRMPLPAKEQDAVYQKPGVPMDRGTQEAWAKAWGNGDLTAANEDTAVKCETSDGSAKIEDCRHAFLSLLKYPDMEAQTGKKGKNFWLGYVHSCAVALEYDSDWDEGSCGITRGDAAMAAYTISDKCSDHGKGLVGGSRKFGKDKCQAKLRIVHTEGLPPSPS